MTETRASTATPIIGIVGWKNSGKTTLATRIISECVARGYRIASVKHAHHNLRIDDKDTDSARHRQAGASQVAVVSGKRWALVTELDNAPEPSLHDIISMLAPSDLIIVEGYKSQPIPKIEVRRLGQGIGPELAETDTHVVAIASDIATANPRNLPIFTLESVPEIVDFIVKALGVAKREERA